MTARKTTTSLPAPIIEPDYPDGDGPQWISTAFGVPGCLEAVTRYLSEDGEHTALVLRFANSIEQVIRPARLVTTRRLLEVLGALGFPVPYYQPPQLALLGQAIGRVADNSRDHAIEDTYSDTCSVVAAWLADCIERHPAYLLQGRAGVDVRAAIEHVHRARGGRSAPIPLIAEPTRGDTGTLLVWTSAVQTVIRDQFGPTSYGTMELALSRTGVNRERLAARAGPGERGTREIPVFVLYNGWQGVEVEIPRQDWENGPAQLHLLGSVVEPYTRARANARTHMNVVQRSTTPNGAVNYPALRGQA